MTTSRRALAFVAAWLLAKALCVAGPTVTTTAGALRGAGLDGGGAVFRGIPFAQPPVGDLRWRAPLPPSPWSGVRDASNPGAPAAQPDLGWNAWAAARSAEDCLYLDVWTSALQAKRPVMVWIHGGANVAGAGGADPVYEGEHLIRHGVVLVVIEYRLGVFGFLAHPELSRESVHHASGNYAILDQIAALQWVHDNIASFGGDPANVTIFGQSAGSIDVLALMASPLARGLFHRAIAESGAPTRSVNVGLRDAEAAGVAFADRCGAPKTGALAFLRRQSVAELLRANPPSPTLTTDGYVFREPTTVTFRTGDAAPVPLIIGTCSIEFPAAGGLENFHDAIARTFGPDASQALRLYGLSPGSAPLPVNSVYGNVADQLGSDLFRCPAIVTGEWQVRATHAVWQYQFDRAIPPQTKVGHSGDLPYVFGSFNLKAGNLVGAYTEADHRLSDAIETYWTNFAKTGNPNGPGVPEWPRYDAKDRTYIEFTQTTNIAVQHNERGPLTDLFRAAMAR